MHMLCMLKIMNDPLLHKNLATDTAKTELSTGWTARSLKIEISASSIKNLIPFIFCVILLNRLHHQSWHSQN